MSGFLDPDLLTLLRQISPEVRKGSRAWLRGLPAHECATLVFGFTADAEVLFDQLVAVCQSDPGVPPTWAFPERPAGFGTKGCLSITDDWIARHCPVEDLPGAKRMLAARYSRDFRHNANTHQRHFAHDVGRPPAAPWGGDNA